MRTAFILLYLLSLTGVSQAACPAGQTCQVFNGTYPYTGTGATAARTDADARSDIYNVKDYGALGNNVNDDTAAIQAAINIINSARAGQDGTYTGTIFFPPGTYKITSALNLFNGNSVNQSFVFQGTGRASLITGSFADYLIRYDPAAGTGGLDNFVLRDMYLKNSYSNAITAASWSGGTATYTTTSAHGVGVGAEIQITGMAPVGYNGTFTTIAGTTGSTVKVTMSNPGAQTTLGILVGGGIKLFNTNTTSIYNAQIAANVAVNTGAQFSFGGAFNVSMFNVHLGGVSGSNPPPGNYGWLTNADAGGCYGCDIQNFDHGIHAFGAAAGSVFGGRIEVNNIGINLGQDETGADNQTSDVTISGVSMEANNEAMYISHASNLVVSAVSIQGSTNAPSGQSAYGIFSHNITTTTFQSVVANGTFSSASFKYDAIPAQHVVMAVIGQNTFGGASKIWDLCTNCMGSTQFIQSNQPDSSVAFASLPASPSQGWEAWINNSNTTTFGATIAGGGASKVKGIFGGTNWTVEAVGP